MGPQGIGYRRPRLGDQHQGAARRHDPGVVAWWREEGGQRVTFGSDAHESQALAAGLADGAAMAEAHDFRPDTRPEKAWIVTE